MSEFQGVSLKKRAGFPGGHPILHPGIPGGHPISHPGFPGGQIASWKSRGSLKKACGIPGGLCKKIAEFQGVIAKSLRNSRGSGTKTVVQGVTTACGIPGGPLPKNCYPQQGGYGHFLEKPIHTGKNYSSNVSFLFSYQNIVLERCYHLPQ